MERCHTYKLGLAILVYAICCGREAVVNGLRTGDSSHGATDNRERRDAVDDGTRYRSSEGIPGVDYPNLAYVPKTKFSCRDMETGYYADLDTDCQVFHICDDGRKLSFLCPNGTIFQQSDLICDWWFKVNCTTSPLLYEESAEILQRENARRKQSRRVSNVGNKQNAFSSRENYRFDQNRQFSYSSNSRPNKLPSATTTESLISTLYAHNSDRRTDNYNSRSSEKNQYRQYQVNNGREKSNFRRNNHDLNTYDTNGSAYTPFNANFNRPVNRNSHAVKSDSFINSRADQNRNIVRETTIKPELPIHVQVNNLKSFNYFPNEKDTRQFNNYNSAASSEETQELQETASFFNNYKNSFQNVQKKTTTNYPNHRETYSEIRDPKYYFEKTFSKLPDKPFYGSSNAPQILSTIPITIQNGYITTPRPNLHIKKVETVVNEAEIIDRSKSLSTGDLFKNGRGIPQVSQTHSKNQSTFTDINVSTNDATFKKSYTSQPSEKKNIPSYVTSTGTPYVKFDDNSNIYDRLLPLSLSPSFKPDDKSFDRLSKTQTTNTKALNRIYQNSRFSVNFEDDETQYKNHRPESNPQINFKLLPHSNNTNVQDYSKNPYIFTTPAVPKNNNVPHKSLSISRSTTESVRNFIVVTPNSLDNILTNRNNLINFDTNNNTRKVIINDTKIKNVSNDKAKGNVANNELYTLDKYKVSANPLSSSKNNQLFYTAQSTLFQPHPFTSTKKIFPTVGVSSGNDLTKSLHYEPYKVSTSTPFGNRKTTPLELPKPTLPTPFLIKSTSSLTAPVDENVNNMITTLMQVVHQHYSNMSDTNTPRPGLIVPPSVGPQTLHSLAIYFANALDSSNITRSSEIQSKEFDENMDKQEFINYMMNEDVIKTLLTQMTKEKYDSLFNINVPEVPTTEFSVIVDNDQTESDLTREDTKSPVQDLSVRQLARVFTEALSAYLDDPDTFRKVLYEVRPTEPPLQMNTTFKEIPEIEEDDEVLNYSDSDLRFDHPHLPTRPVGLQASPTWGYILAIKNSTEDVQDQVVHNSLTNDSESLHLADSQSFISQLKKIKDSIETTTEVPFVNVNPLTTISQDTNTLPNDHWTSSMDVTKLWSNTLSVNPATLNTDFGKVQVEDSSPELDTSSTKYFNSLGSSEDGSIENVDNSFVTDDNEAEINYELRGLQKLHLNSSEVHGILIDFMHSNRSKGPAKLHRLLDKLNITENEFLDKMEEVENNPLARRLVLLLISECNIDNLVTNKEDEPGENNDGTIKYDANPLSLEIPNATTTVNTPDRNNLLDDVTESNIYQDLVDSSIKNDHEDKRALELLNSLYVIASKFGK